VRGAPGKTPQTVVNRHIYLILRGFMCPKKRQNKADHDRSRLWRRHHDVAHIVIHNF
jgi:hypothetical protein